MTTATMNPPARDSADKASPPAEAPAKGEEDKSKAAPMSRRKKVILVLVGATLVIAGLVYYIHSRGYEDTDDAEIDGNISSVSSRVVGTVRAVHVQDNQVVKTGDALVDLDPADLDVALAQARAQLTQAEAELEAEDPNVPIVETSNKASTRAASSDIASSLAALSAAHAEIHQLAAQLAQAEAIDRTAEVEKERSMALVREGAVTPSDNDSRANAASASAANVEAIRQALQAAKAREGESAAKVEASRIHLEEVTANAPRQVAARRANLAMRKADVELAKAQVAQAELNRSYATVLAPVPGIVGKKTVNVGDRVTPGQELMAISPTEDLWVTANFRETQLEKIRVGQRTKIHVDAVGESFTGVVESIGGATGARYSVLPPENATGNYVKVVQRIPVRVRLDPGQAGFERLRQGMSVEPTVTLK